MLGTVAMVSKRVCVFWTLRPVRRVLAGDPSEHQDMRTRTTRDMHPAPDFFGRFGLEWGKLP